MARFRSSIRPIQRIKHVVDISQATAAGVNLVLPLIIAIDAPVIANVQEVVTGSTVNAIYLRVEVASNEAISLGAVPNFYVNVQKNPGNNLSNPVANAVGVSDNKRFVIHQEMTMIENKGQGSNSRTAFNGVIVIPKGYRRFGPNDRLDIALLSPALDVVTCLQCHFKEFR